MDVREDGDVVLVGINSFVAFILYVSLALFMVNVIYLKARVDELEREMAVVKKTFKTALEGGARNAGSCGTSEALQPR